MKTSILSMILALSLASKMSGQSVQTDTVHVYIERKLHDADGKTHLWFSKVENGEILDSRKDTLFYTVCECPSERLPDKGQYSKILRRDMIFIDRKVSWRKVNN